MSFEARIKQLLDPLVRDSLGKSGRVYPDTTPDAPKFPLIVYQGAGGSEQWYVEGGRREKRHIRLQVHVWADRRAQANEIAAQVSDAIRTAGFEAAEPYGVPVWLYEEALKKYGTRQDFGIWYLP